MSDDQPKSRSMNDISHLFLSNVRDLHGKGAAKPQRTPPGGPPPAGAGDLTAEEIAGVTAGRDAPTGAGDDDEGAADADTHETAPVTAVLASHLSGRQGERVREYARHLAASAGRVGLIDLDVNDFRLTCFDPAAEPGEPAGGRPTEIAGGADPREIAAAVEELNVDVDRWVLLVPNLRTPEATALVADAEHWSLLCTPDHDGVVAAYRTLKGVAEARVAAGGDRPPTKLTVAVLDAAGDAEAARVQQKLASVSRQFLGWDADAEPPVRYAAGVAEHPLMHCRVSGGRGQAIVGPHWAAIAELLGRPRRGAKAAELAAAAARRAAQDRLAAALPPAAHAGQAAGHDVRRVSGAPPAHHAAAPLPPPSPVDETEPNGAPMPAEVWGAAAAAEPPRMRIDPGIAAAAATPALPFAPPVAGPAASLAPALTLSAAPTPDDVLELPGDVAGAAGVLAAVLRRAESGLAECPVAPPACAAAAKLAVTRDRGLVLVAAAARGLADLRAIGHAYRWLTENASLIALALPQFAIDAARTPGLHLLVDQGDISGEALRPIMQAGHVHVRAYRTLRWAGRTGLLLDAA